MPRATTLRAGAGAARLDRPHPERNAVILRAAGWRVIYIWGRALKGKLRLSEEEDGKELVSVEEIKQMFDETWHIAVVTKREDRLLTPQKIMPRGRKRGDDILARYRRETGGIELRFDLHRANEDAEQCRFILNS